MKKSIRTVSDWRKKPIFSKSPRIGAASLILLVYPFVWAQEADDEDIFELSPFEVDGSKDVGWRSTNSTAGTSLNTAVKDIPMSIEVINSDFLDDQQAISFEDAMEYSSGVNLIQSDSNGGNNGPNEATSNEQSASAQGSINTRFTNGVSIRGYTVTYQNRLGFRYGGAIPSFGVTFGGIIDNVNAGRYEVARGPNSLLYGVGVLSGIVNLVPKRPLSEPAGEVSVSVGSDDLLRTTFDWSAPLIRDFMGGGLNYRFATANTTEGTWDNETSDTEYYVGQLEYRNDKLSVFLEYQQADKIVRGIGTKSFAANLGGSFDPDGFRTEYNEPYNWYRYFTKDGDYWNDLDIDNLSEDDQELYNRVDDEYDPSFRLVGDSAYDQLDETNFLINVEYSPLENLSFSVGSFITEVEQETLNVSGGTQTNSDDIDAANFLRESSDVAAEFWDEFVFSRESPIALANPDTAFDLNDHRTIRYGWTLTPKITNTEQHRVRVSYDFETADLWGDSKAKHVLSAGYNYIHDEADFTTGNSNSHRDDRDYTGTHGLGGNIFPGEESVFTYRAVDDFSPLEYEGTPLAYAGTSQWLVDVWYRSAYGLYKGDFFNEKVTLLAGYRYDEYFTRERLYDRFDETNFFLPQTEEELSPFDSNGDVNNAYYPLEDYPLGVPYPLYLRDIGSSSVDADGNVIGVVSRPEANLLNARGIIWENDGSNTTYGFRPSETTPLEYGPGTEYSNETSLTLALNYDITENLTAYVTSSGGVTPNIGLRDGLNDPIPSETTTNAELGLKFEVFDGKLSGSLSLYQIERENAVYGLATAPNPSSYFGGELNDDNDSAFVPDILIGEGGIGGEGSTPINYSVNEEVFYAAFDEIFEANGIDLSSDDLSMNNQIRDYERDENGVAIDFDDNNAFGVYGVNSGSIFLDYNELDNPVTATSATGAGGYTHYEFTGGEFSEVVNPSGVARLSDVTTVTLPELTWREVIETAFADRSRNASSGLPMGFIIAEEYNPLYTGGKDTADQKNNSSRTDSASVTFTDVAKGYDLQLIYQPTTALQFIFNFAHVEREVDGTFNMVDAAFEVDGVNYQFGTEYDAFVRTFGREAFGFTEVFEYDANGDVVTDVNGHPKVIDVLYGDRQAQAGDARASELVGGVDDLSLYFSNEDDVRLVTQYTFQEGFLKDLSMNLGIVYNGKAQTAVSVGGSGLAENLYPTPYRAERVYANLNFRYKWTWGDFPITARFGISNVGNDTHGVSFAEYINVIDGSVEKRRTEDFYAPRAYRLQLTTSF